MTFFKKLGTRAMAAFCLMALSIEVLLGILIGIILHPFGPELLGKDLKWRMARADILMNRLISGKTA